MEFQIKKGLIADIAIIDRKRNIPIQIFEIKSKKTAEIILAGKEQLRHFASNLENKEVPLYLVFPTSIPPYFEIVRVNDFEEQNLNNITATQSAIINYEAQKTARIVEEADIVKTKKRKEIDKLKLVSWILSFLTFVIGFLNRTKIIPLELIDLSIWGVVVGLILLPFASKLKILGMEFERLVEK